MSEAAHSRTLIFVVSYQAERHLESVLNRVPDAVWADPGVHLLVIDDASSDRSVSNAAAWARAHRPGRVTVLRNPVNQGYGGNQKLGYRIAIEQGFDFVVLLHGDGQYAPELLPTFLDTYKSTGADVVLGTRMDRIASARAGGMPWYKVIGNRILSGIQNRMTGQRFAEWHTGYRGYATRFLNSVPFEMNTNEFHFDTEILLQAVHVGAKVCQFPIPTRYGDETCHVDGRRYAMDVMLATMQFRLHQIGMMCSLKYRHLDQVPRSEQAGRMYNAQRRAIEIVRERGMRRVLELGYASGDVSRRLREVGCDVTRVDVRPPRPGIIDRLICAHPDAGDLPIDAFDFDAVLLLNLLEQLPEPELFLVRLRNGSRAMAAVREPPLMVIATPNVAFVAMRLNLLAGRFSYAERGILDLRHRRLFTRSSLRRALLECGYDIESIEPIAVPFETVINGSVGRVLGGIARLLAWCWPRGFAFQWLVTARPKPGVRQLLAQAERHVEP